MKTIRAALESSTFFELWIVGFLIITNFRTHSLKSEIEILKQALDKEHSHVIIEKKLGDVSFRDTVFVGENID